MSIPPNLRIVTGTPPGGPRDTIDEVDAAFGRILQTFDAELGKLQDIRNRYWVIKGIRRHLNYQMECMVLSPTGILFEP